MIALEPPAIIYNDWSFSRLFATVAQVFLSIISNSCPGFTLDCLQWLSNSFHQLSALVVLEPPSIRCDICLIVSWDICGLIPRVPQNCRWYSKKMKIKQLLGNCLMALHGGMSVLNVMHIKKDYVTSCFAYQKRLSLDFLYCTFWICIIYTLCTLSGIKATQ